MCIDIGLGFPEHPNIHYTYLAHLGVLNLDSHQLGTGRKLGGRSDCNDWGIPQIMKHVVHKHFSVAFYWNNLRYYRYHLIECNRYRISDLIVSGGIKIGEGGFGWLLPVHVLGVAIFASFQSWVVFNHHLHGASHGGIQSSYWWWYTNRGMFMTHKKNGNKKQLWWSVCGLFL